MKYFLRSFLTISIVLGFIMSPHAISAAAPTKGLSGAGDKLLKKVDMKVVRQTWLGWYNTERESLGRAPYTYNSRLNNSAYRWSKAARSRGYIDHKRPGQTAYYDYPIIAQWFKDFGLVFENVYRVTFSENIGGGYYKCVESDCTQEMIDALRPTFDFYMREKGKPSAPHYNSMTNKYFKEIGLGIAVNNSNGKLYITIHYGTRIL
jgi:uncharacterized protein YkwD